MLVLLDYDLRRFGFVFNRNKVVQYEAVRMKPAVKMFPGVKT